MTVPPFWCKMILLKHIDQERNVMNLQNDSTILNDSIQDVFKNWDNKILSTCHPIWMKWQKAQASC